MKREQTFNAMLHNIAMQIMLIVGSALQIDVQHCI
jgi:hypothetical protein